MAACFLIERVPKRNLLQIVDLTALPKKSFQSSNAYPPQLSAFPNPIRNQSSFPGLGLRYQLPECFCLLY